MSRAPNPRWPPLFWKDQGKRRENNKTIFFIGNGESASTASHFVNDISLGSRQFEKPFRAISLCDNQAVITAIGNDDGYENIFLQQLQTQAKAGDVLVAISASGNSPNIIKAINWAKDNDLTTVGLSAFDGGMLAKLSNLNIHVPTKIGEYGPAEDLHMVICGLVGSFFRAHFKKWFKLIKSFQPLRRLHYNQPNF